MLVGFISTRRAVSKKYSKLKDYISKKIKYLSPIHISSNSVFNKRKSYMTKIIIVLTY